jgi:YVTN family beta-propeller protein
MTMNWVRIDIHPPVVLLRTSRGSQLHVDATSEWPRNALGILVKSRLVEFRILGSVEADLDGQPLPLGGRKPRALLAMLLLNRNAVVSRERLIEGLWGESPPAGADHSLDDYVSRLRRSVGSERLIRKAPGYRLTVEPGELDLDVFERLVERGRSEIDRDAKQAAGTLRQALDLWRGPALADLAYEPFAAVEGSHLEERHLAALEARIEADLAAGRKVELVAELEALLHEHPLRERFVGQLMLALYRSGRQSSALDVFRRTRMMLIDELGLEPAPELRELERRILAHDPSLSATPGETSTPRQWRRGRNVRLAAGVAVTVVVVVGTFLGLRLAIGKGGGPSVRPAVGSGLAALDQGSGRPVASPVALPASPAGIAAGRNSLWVTAPDAGAVLRVDPASRALIERIPLAGSPSAVAVAPGAIWVGTASSGELNRIDPTTDAVVQTVDLGGASAGALTYGNRGLWVADTADGALIEIDPESGAVRRTIVLGLRPTAVAAGRGVVWAADYQSNTVVEVSAASRQTLATVHVGNGPTAIAVSSGAVWVANGLDATVSRIDPATAAVVATIPVGSGPSSIVAGGGSVWVGNQYSQNLTRIDERRNVAEAAVPIGGGPTALASIRGELWVGTQPVAQHRGGTLRLLSTSRFPIDPALNYVLPPFQSTGLTSDSLVAFQHTGGPAGLRLVPDLAVSLPAPVDGGRTWTFRLRSSIRYSDGRRLRASDFRRAFERLFQLRSPASGFFNTITGADVCLRRGATTCDLTDGISSDDKSGIVTFHLDVPDPDFLFKLAVGGFSAPVPRGTPFRAVGFRPVLGTGPYKIVRADADGIRYIRNPWFREWSHAAQPDGSPNEIIWRFGLSPAEEAKAIAAGQADWMLDSPPAGLAESLRTHYAGRLHSSVSQETDFYKLNTTLSPFNDRRVRRALNLAIDRNAIIRLYGGPEVAAPTCQVLPPAIPGYRRYCPYTQAPNSAGRWRAPDTTRARRLVASSGTRDQHITVWGWTDDATISPAVTRYVADVLRRLGYRVTTRLVSHRGFDRLSFAVRRAIQLLPNGWVADYPSASDFISIWLSCAGAYDNGWFCDPQLDRQMRRAGSLQVSAPALAARLWSKVDRRIVDEAAWVPLVNPVPVDFVSGRVGNYQHNLVNGIVADQLWLR